MQQQKFIEELENPTKFVEFSDIESFTENIKPVRKGLRMDALECLASASQQVDGKGSHGATAAFAERRLAFEEELRACSESGDAEGLLTVWFDYIDFAEQLSALSRSGELPALLERATRELAAFDALRDDERLLELWLLHSDGVFEPLEVFSDMEAQGVGVRRARFYERWALVLEDRGMFREANDAFERGEAMLAQPLDELRASHRHFQQRALEAEARRSRLAPAAERARAGAPARRKLGEISAKEARSHVRPTARAVQARAQLTRRAAPPPARAGAIAVFDDENAHAAPPAESAPRHVFGAGRLGKPVSASEAAKENRGTAQPWARAGALPQRKYSARPVEKAPDLEVFEDEDDAGEEEQTVNAGSTGTSAR